MVAVTLSPPFAQCTATTQLIIRIVHCIHTKELKRKSFYLLVLCFTTKIDVYTQTLTEYNAPAVSKSCLFLFSCHLVSLTTESYLRLCQGRRSRRLHRRTNENTSPKLLITGHYCASQNCRAHDADANFHGNTRRLLL